MREIIRLIFAVAILLLTIVGCCHTVKFMHELTDVNKNDQQNYKKNYDYENVRDYLYDYDR